MIDSLRGKYRFLSNFYPCLVNYQGVDFPSVEHAFQAHKSLDRKVWQRFAALETAAEAKSLGRQIQLREDWHEVRVNVMYTMVKQKFAQNHDLRVKLRNTHPHEIVEGNNWGDTFWGAVNGEGENYLGKILMKVRKQVLKQVQSHRPDNPAVQVVNLRHDEYDVYIGRPSVGRDGYWGNPIILGKPCIVCTGSHHEPGSTLECYEQWLQSKVRSDTLFRERLLTLDGKTLGCFCKPGPCHGDILGRVLEELL